MQTINDDNSEELSESTPAQLCNDKRKKTSVDFPIADYKMTKMIEHISIKPQNTQHYINH